VDLLGRDRSPGHDRRRKSRCIRKRPAAPGIRLGHQALLALLSVPRTLAIAAISFEDKRPRLSLAALYGGTTASAIGILGLAVWLAHG
jgi:hypothetical protein